MFWTRLLLLTVLAFVCCCGNPDFYDEYDEECPFDWVPNEPKEHLWRPVVSIEPVRAVYNVGDTLKVMAVVDDLLYDHRALAYFDIPEHPFYPITQLTQVLSDTIQDGLTRGQVRVVADSIYEARLTSSPVGLAGIIFRYQRPDEQANYRQVVFKYVLYQPGRYLMINSDGADIAREYEAPELYDYEFPCEVITNTRDVYTLLKHEDHLDEYHAELQRILVDVYNNDYRSSISVEGMKVSLRRQAAFAFEVR